MRKGCEPTLIYATGDTHADFQRFNTDIFPEQKDMSRKDIVLIAGDFGGIWAPASPFPLISERDRHRMLKQEETTLDWLASKNCTFAFVLGNHENWNRFDSDEFPIIDFYGGKAHQLRENVFHLMSGYVFDFDGYTVYAFGGASSHDISDGILDRNNYDSDEAFKTAYKVWKRDRYLFRVKNYSWWEREAKPTEEEIKRGWANLEKYGNHVDLILSHCLPSSIATYISSGAYKPDEVTRYLQMVAETVDFGAWICGHYHRNEKVMGKFCILYEQIVRIA